uniref:Uncharacterized protein n=1 Tax=Chlamydomonas euryale TaxID=1486919 RepID=A0A7R9Z789_9CHLO|mmetsp:Transcript_9169/g.27919  ORF Transcript_9169/g.27919 Transcript_9169/m.27919 type:complete len:273 (+) Transcript_9169:327-1145(+)
MCRLLDVLGYALNCAGFAKCGAALSMVVGSAASQLCTAAAQAVLLRRPLGGRRGAAVALVTAGLVVRGVGGLPHGRVGLIGGGADPARAVGVALVVTSSVCYSLLGVAYEGLLRTPGGELLSQAQINGRMACVGAAAASAYQLLYTAPRWQQLVVHPVEASGLSYAAVALHYAVFGALFTAHLHVQGRAFGRLGVVAVGIVNALRTAAVSVASAVFFCRPSAGATGQCLSPSAAASAALVTAGAALWATTTARCRDAVVDAAPGAPVHEKQH